MSCHLKRGKLRLAAAKEAVQGHTDLGRRTMG